MDLDKIRAIQSWPTPKSICELCGFLALAGYYRCFIKHYWLLYRPLHDLLKAKNFKSREVSQDAFTKLKEALTSSLVLTIPNFSQGFPSECDASNLDIRAVLPQEG